MLRYAELVRVLGRRLTDRLVRAGWITPLPGSSSRAIYFNRKAVHAALRRLSREPDALNGYVRMPVTFERPKVQTPSLEEAFADAELFLE
jgi:hypothetical protein